MKIGSRRQGLWVLLGMVMVATGCSSGGGGGDDPGGGPPPVTTWKISGVVTGGGANPVTLTLAPGGATTTTDATSGAYSFSGLANGAYTVTPSKVGFTFTPASQTVTVAGADRTLSFTASAVVGPVYTLSGTITDGLVGIADVSVSLSGDASGSVLTGADGTFTFASLPAGSYHLVPTRAGTVFAPPFADETIVAADVVSDFVGSAAPTYAIAGAVTGPWVEGITVTLTNADGVVGTATTGPNGTYGFSGLADATSYSVTPSLTGYGYTPSPANVTLAGADQSGVDFAASSNVAGYRISGTINYSGSRPGRVYVMAQPAGCPWCDPSGGTSFPTTRAKPWTYELRGVPSSPYTVTAYIDTLGFGLWNASFPSGTSATVDVASADVSAVDVTMTHPTPPTFSKPNAMAVGGDRSALIVWSRDEDAQGAELASGYRVSWGTTSATSDGSTDVSAHNAPLFLHGGAGVTNGSVWWYRVVPYFIDASGSKLLGSASSDPLSVTIGPVANGVGASTVNVRADFPGVTPAGSANLYAVLIRDSNPPEFRIARAATAATGTTISVTGVPDGTWSAFAILDQDGDGNGWGTGDLGLGSDGSLIAPAAATYVVGGTPGPAQAGVATHFRRDEFQDTYAISSYVRSAGPQVVSVVLWSGKGVALPSDLGMAWGEFVKPESPGVPTAPQVGEAYVYRVTYADGSFEDVTATIDTVFGPAQLATGLTERTTGTSGATALSRQIPEFSWTAPPSVASPSFYVWLERVGGGFSWNDNVVSGTSSLFDGAPLETGVEYLWYVRVSDAAGNTAEGRKSYTP